MAKQPNKKPQAIQITSPDQLTKLLTQPIIARFKVDDVNVELPCRRLTPAEEERLRQIERSVRPIRVPNKAVSGGFEYDTQSVEYIERVARVRKMARAMAVYLGCPAVNQMKPGVVTPEEITAFIEGLWTEWIIEIVAQTIRMGGIGVPAEEQEVNDLANFTTSPE